MDKPFPSSQFDNQMSILYKWARYLKVPSKYVLANPSNSTFYSYISLIRNSVKHKIPLDTIVNDPLFINLDARDIALIYAYILLPTNPKSRQNIASQLLSEINNMFAQHNVPEEYKSPTDLINAVEEWHQNFQQQVDQDDKFLESITHIQKYLSTLNPTLVSPIEINSAELSFSPFYKSENQEEPLIPTTANALELFDTISVNKYIPYIRLNLQNNPENHNLTKLYKGISADATLNYDSIIPNPKFTNLSNILYTTIWLGHGNIDKAPQNTFQHGTYNLESNLFRIKTLIHYPDIDENLLIQRLSDSFPLDFNNYTENRLAGLFYAYHINIDGNLFVDMVLNDPIVSSYFFVDESVKSYALKKRLTLRYRSLFDTEEQTSSSPNYILNPSAVHITINQHYATGNETITYMEDDKLVKDVLAKDDTFLEIKFSKASSRKDVASFLKIFSYILSYYVIVKESLFSSYKKLIPEFGETAPVVKTKSVSKTKRTGDRLQQLSEYAPDLFVKGYGRQGCQKNNQPIWVEKKDIENIKKQKFVFRGKTFNRQVMPFPPKEPLYYFTCDLPKNKKSSPFPGVKKNNLSNKDTFPCIPCCGKLNQLDNPKSKYYRCKEGKLATESKSSAHEMKGNKTVKSGHKGLLRPDLLDLLSTIADIPTESIYRYGIPTSPNSLLHAILLATDDQYPKNPKSAEKYVTKQRAALNDYIYPSLLKQELYDYTDDEIEKQLNDTSTYLDPRLFYRALEQVYNVNIFVFQPTGSNDTEFDLPRFKLFPSRTPRPTLPSVCIYKSEGTVAQSLPFPHCELIVNSNKKTTQLLWPPSVSTALFNAFTSTLQTISWIAQPDQSLVNIPNLYSHYNFLDYFPNAKSQILDNYGKLRGFIYPAKDNTLATVIFPPSQPVNLPTAQNFPTVSYPLILKDLTEIFGTPSSVSRNDENVTGIWFPLENIDNGIYVPIHPTKLTEYPDGPVNPLDALGINIITKYRKISRDLEIILQICQYLYILAKRPDLSTFISTYFTIGSGSNDSEHVYELNNLGTYLPDVETIEEGLIKLQELAPSLVREEKVYLYSDTFANGIFYALKLFAKETDGLDLAVPNILSFRNLLVTDFTPFPNVAIFLSDRDLLSWLDSRGRTNFQNLVILNQISEKSKQNIEPFIYSPSDTSFFIVQNVKDGDLDRALNVALFWYENNINLGFYAKIEDNQTVAHKIYKASPDAQTLVLVSDNSEGEENFLRIFVYGKNHYAALLPL